MVASLLRPLGALLGVGLLLVGLAPPAAAAPRKLPSYLHVCKRGDPQLEQCVLTSVEKIRPKLLSGIPELNVPSMEPLIIPELVIRPSPRFQAVGKDVQVFGGSNFKVTRLRIEVNATALSFVAGVSVPHLSFVSDYQVDGQILVLPIKGRGQLTANVSDVTGSLHLLGKIVKRKGAEYLQFVEGEFRLELLSPVKIHLDNLFNGDKALGEATNAALNENSEELTEVVVPVAERVVAQFALDTANKISSAFPFDQLLPKN
ncbi:hypothetical protein R5R35_004085 [Gryllus longicercus]|uniref:Protein takeout-like n=1 Tax=Gryllus longicercus TaxID=2509291 RepID=A0AAN9VLM2_9ORTH